MRPDLLEAARVSATVTDPHLLRVLDCDDDDGITWVVNEWGDGVSLDLMLQQGTLPPSRAAWLAREVAEAIAAGHAQGVAHGRLNPEAVLVTARRGGQADRVRRRRQPRATRAARPGCTASSTTREADVINLAGILYAALTGRWPGVAPLGRSAGARDETRGRCARARCAPACRARSTRSATGCCTRRPPSTRCRSRPRTRSPPRWPTTSATLPRRTGRRPPACTPSRPLDRTATAARRSRAGARAGAPDTGTRQVAEPDAGSEPDPESSSPTEPKAEPESPSRDRVGAATRRRTRSSLRRARRGTRPLAPLHARRGQARHRHRRSRTPPSGRCSPDRAPGPGDGAGPPPTRAPPAEPGGTAGTPVTAPPAAVWRDTAADPAHDSDPGTGPRFWPFDDTRRRQRRPHRQGGPRLAAAGDRGRAYSSSWWWRWPSPSTAAAQDGTTRRLRIRAEPRAATPRPRARPSSTPA